ncbi:UDP-3-O-[3-hydroxymyristoyl] N-acetylglucosamine deacetylase [Rhizomicrobium palustre]|uniref:UDP-3-O-acyl-N-acetylglucosamine deacetylase n=1 Tax=Rhizomicrobium palustre TaxID=189966 RepID=A0A846MVC6_9PROT|nr:UDP-3-O-acyl-N-acetylglucosamine deacetylase [Rhizomicrobium palustre]NIK87488.1 UDP-3-O-[3-hydroxymyristoyl] N-acetylglucosamine deacetylase [Rhizomicrobium palustre]
MAFRRTIAKEVACEGIALHAGTQVRMLLEPAVPGTGIIFRRLDLDGAEIPALYDRVAETTLGTTLAEGKATIAVVEHLMAAVAGAGIDDLVIQIDGAEPPVLDGDALSFLELLDVAGAKDSDVERQAIKVLRRVEVSHKDASAALIPAQFPQYAVEIEFASAAIGHQAYAVDFTPAAFRAEIAPARTFGDIAQLDALKKMDRGHGASLHNTLAIDGDRVLNADIQRFPDEFVRHKILDAVGDLSLAGTPLIARFEGIKSGHALNNQLLRALFADPANYRLITAP